MIELRQQFSTRFSDIREYKNQFKVFGTPFATEIDEAPVEFQMELIDLQSDGYMREKYMDIMKSENPKDVNLMDFYKSLQSAGEYPNLVNHAKQMASVFGSTYRCEKLFSSMKHAKSTLRTNLTEVHLNDCLLLANSSLKPEIEKLSKNMQHQKSH